MTLLRVGVVFEGVVGLSIAHDMAERGHDGTVLADRTAAQSVSAVAAAVWFPYLNGSSPSVLSWLSRSRLRFAELATVDATGVDLHEGTVVERRSDADRTWTAALGACREARQPVLGLCRGRHGARG